MKICSEGRDDIDHNDAHSLTQIVQALADKGVAGCGPIFVSRAVNFDRCHQRPFIGFQDLNFAVGGDVGRYRELRCRSGPR